MKHTILHPLGMLEISLIFETHCNALVTQLTVRVTTMDAELEFSIQSTTTGKQLFDQVGCQFNVMVFVGASNVNQQHKRYWRPLDWENTGFLDCNTLTPRVFSLGSKWKRRFYFHTPTHMQYHTNIHARTYQHTQVMSHDVKKDSVLSFRFRCKYFPEDVTEELIQDNTKVPFLPCHLFMMFPC